MGLRASGAIFNAHGFAELRRDVEDLWLRLEGEGGALDVNQEDNGQIETGGDITDYVTKATKVNAGAGLTGGGALSGDVTLSLNYTLTNSTTPPSGGASAGRLYFIY